jgi:hypothetical protein
VTTSLLPTTRLQQKERVVTEKLVDGSREKWAPNLDTVKLTSYVSTRTEQLGTGIGEL